MTNPDPLTLAVPTQEQLLTVKEFAALTGMHPNSIYKRIRAGRQPGVVNMGTDYRINVRKALEGAIDSGGSVSKG